jgi:hypothetical protein
MGTFAVQALLAFAFSYVASLLLEKKDKSFKDDRPTALATRGEFIPYVIGRRRIGYIFAFAGNRRSQNEDAPGGGGILGGLFGGGAKIKVYHETGWHLLCIGPVTRLLGIQEGGKIISGTQIDSSVTPSGSTKDLGKAGWFRIYWGEENQPVNIGMAFYLEISSSWPHQASIYWGDKRLSTSPTWNLMDYEVEVRLQPTGLSQSAPWIAGADTLSGHVFTFASVTNGAVGTASFKVTGDQRQYFLPGGKMYIQGNSIPDGDYIISHSTYLHHTGDYLAGTFVLVDLTTVYFALGISGMTILGTVETYLLNIQEGPNPAHVIWQLLFQRWPWGLYLDQADFDIPSLENLGVFFETVEVTPVSLFNQHGDDLSGMLASLMQDIGVMISLNVSDGKYYFIKIRDLDPMLLPSLTIDLLAPPQPEKIHVHEKTAADRLVYVFQDRARHFRDMTVSIDDDGSASRVNYSSPRKIQMPTITDYPTAVKVAERRAQEDIVGPTVYRILAGREARKMIPGTGFFATGTSEVLRLLSVLPDALTSKVLLEAAVDVYGAIASDHPNSDGGGISPGNGAPSADYLFMLYELPEYLNKGSQALFVPRIRQDTEIEQADIWISQDDVLYEQELLDTQIYTGGLLVTPLLATDPSLQMTGPIISILGPDIDIIPSLTGDLPNWRIGKIWCMILDEICFIQNPVSLGGGQYRLDGLMRARYDTVKADHGVSTPVFLFLREQITPFTDTFLTPNMLLYAKTQPSSGESTPLSDVEPVSRVLLGKGVVPMLPANLRTVNLANSYRTNEDVPFYWAFRSTEFPKTGAGMQGAGTAVGSSSPEGEFILTFKTISNGVKLAVSGILTNSYTITNAALRAAFGSEPTSFRVDLANKNGGYSSPIIFIIVTRN